MPTPENVIYGLSCACHSAQGIRYVGLTSRSLTSRLREHRRDSLKANPALVHAWMRDHEVQADVLEVVQTRAGLRAAEIRWMARLRSQGADLLNGTDFWTIVDGVWQRAS